MSAAGWLQLAALVLVVLVTTRVLGPYLARVLEGAPSRGDRVFLPVERLVYRVIGVDPSREQRWTVYALSLLAFSGISVVGLFLLQRFQGSLFLNPTDMVGVPPALAFNTAASFVTNTNWQNYGGESTMSHLTQMSGLAVQNFVSAAVGVAVAVALIRGFTRRRSDTIGNFWVDITRVTTRVLLPLSVVVALVLVSQGVVQNLDRLHRGDHRRGRAAVDPRRPDREPGGDQGARDERRRALQRQLGASVREPERLLEPRRDVGAPRDPLRPHVRLRPARPRPAPGLGALRRDVRALDRVRRDRDGLRDRRQPGGRGARHDRRRQLRGQGGPLRRARIGPLRGVDDGHVDRRRHRRARQLHAARRRRSSREHDARGGEPGRRRRRPLRDADLRAPRRLHRRADGRPHARVPRQEDPGDGDEARRPLSPDRPDAHPRLRLGLRRSRRSEVVDPEPRPARPLRGRLRVHLGGEQQRLGVRRPDREHRLVQHDARPGDARRPLPPHRARPRDRGGAGAQAARSRHGRDVPDRDAALRRPPRRRDPDHGRAHVLPRSRPRADPRGAGACSGQATALAPRPRDPAPRRRRELPEARPAAHGAQPGHVRRRARKRARHVPVAEEPLRLLVPGERLRRPRRRLALVHGALRELRGGRRRGSRQGAGRRAAEDARRHHRPSAARLGRARGRPERRSSGSATRSSSPPAR